MKTRPLIHSTLLAGTILISLIAVGCGNKSTDEAEVTSSYAEEPVTQAKPEIEPAEKTSFDEVTAELNPGGNFYMYLSTEQALAKIDGFVDGAEQLVLNLPRSNGTPDATTIEKGFDVLRRFVEKSGVKSATGLGISSVAIEDGVYHSKAFLHHRKGEGDGFLWTTFGKKPGKLEGLSMLPSKTVLADFGEVNLKELLSQFEEVALSFGSPKAKEGIAEMKEAFEVNSGVAWDDFINSFEGSMGLALTLDPEKQVPLPSMGEEPVTFPEPGLLIVLKVRDNLLYDHASKIMGGNPNVQQIQKAGMTGISMPLPLPIPMQLMPTLVRYGDYLILGSSQELVMESISVHKGETEGLTSTEEFKALSKEISLEGNAFVYSSKRLGVELAKLQESAMNMASAMNPQMPNIQFQKLFGLGDPQFAFMVMSHQENGWKMSANGNFQPAFSILAGGAIAPAGLLAAIAIPNFVKARATAQKNTCIANLKQLDGAKQQWALENKKGPLNSPTQAELNPYLKVWPSCPLGGIYTVGPVKDNPTCSHEGHELR